MKFEEVMPFLRDGKSVFNNGWNGLKIAGRIMYVSLLVPVEQHITEPFFMFHSGVFKVTETDDSSGWNFRRFPWTPSALDLMSDGWEIRVE